MTVHLVRGNPTSTDYTINSTAVFSNRLILKDAPRRMILNDTSVGRDSITSPDI